MFSLSDEFGAVIWWISVNSPVARILMNKPVGDEIIVKNQCITANYRILPVSGLPLN
ncbi:GreA/GreB family elongation factor [Photorhabdus stackebrandtii]|uniref:Transcription elongation factor GreA/GreB C-terminal domain-containing protein n=1 Tax=Photorhabdus stackebrandtii TaxID=1123042 RepID=A0A7X5TKF2_9GAMM|nr:hypothetical protein [Photorhabdus stackebrandtii]